MYRFIERTVGYEIVENPHQAFEGGRGFGEFQRMLTDLSGEPLFETIPSFHDVELRIQRFERAVSADAASRVRDVPREIEWVQSRADEMTRFVRLGRAGELPFRITHNDTKFNNVLLDAESDEAVCVIDLDTVMPGFVLYDFGDSIRTATNTAAEDEEDTSKVRIDLDLYQGYAKGYLSESAGFLTEVELANLAFSSLVMTYTIGIRFFTDYLEGDHYFKIHRPLHNLIRSRAQFALLESMESGLGRMDEIVQTEYSRVKERSA
jgi:thiamine kinase-like enzyme